MDKKIFAVVLLSVFSLVFLPLAAGAACSQVSGKTYYTDGVSFFSDTSCHNEMTAAEKNAAGAVYIATGNANCRYSLAKELYTDGTAFFTNNKCTSEAEAGQTVPAPVSQTTATQAATTAAPAQTSVIGATQIAQMSRRIDALESQMKIMMSIVSQILTLLAQK